MVRNQMIMNRFTSTAAVIAAVTGLFLSNAGQAQTPAGTVIPNSAVAHYSIDAVTVETASGVATVKVDELLDLALSAASPTIAVPPTGPAAIPFVLDNRGNGHEAFILAAAASAGGVTGFAVDVDGDGRFDPARDVVLGDGAVTPSVAPGARLKLLALVKDVGTGATLTLTAVAQTGSGTRGLLVDRKGDGDSDAIVGDTTARASLALALTPQASTPAEAQLEKSQSVSASDGSTAPMPGATITYSLAARFPNGTARAAVVSDPIPDGTRYVAGSLTLDGAPLPDTAGADQSSFDGTAIRVALGDVTGPANHTIMFKVIIK